jgi:hypothetical protein
MQCAARDEAEDTPVAIDLANPSESYRMFMRLHQP